jgi:hypothetical protein
MHGVLDDDDSIHGHAPSVSSVMLYVVFWLTGTCTELLPLTSHACMVCWHEASVRRTMAAVWGWWCVCFTLLLFTGAEMGGPGPACVGVCVRHAWPPRKYTRGRRCPLHTYVRHGRLRTCRH